MKALTMFNAKYVGERFPYSMTKDKTYTVFWVDVTATGKTYFLVCDEIGEFTWVDKDEFVLPLNL